MFYFIPFSVTLTLTWVHKVKGRAKPLGFIFSQTFQLIRNKFGMVLKQFRLSILILLLSEISESREFFLTVYKEKDLTLACIQTFMNQFGPNFL